MRKGHLPNRPPPTPAGPPPSEIVVKDGRLYHLGFAPGEVAENLILVGDPARAYLVAEHFATVEHEIKNREFVTLTGRFQDLPVSVIGTGIGADNVEIALIETYVVHSFDLETCHRLAEPPKLRYIRVGTSGGAQSDIEAGTLAVAEYALGLDATGLYFDHPAIDPTVLAIEARAKQLLDGAVAPSSRFHGKLEAYASRSTPHLFKALERVARAKDPQVTTGITVTSPGFYGASSRFIDGLVNTVPDIKGTLAKLEVDGRRVVNFEMESSLLFHLGEQLGIDGGAICTVISQAQTHDSLIDYAPRIQRGIEIALATLVELAGS